MTPSLFDVTSVVIQGITALAFVLAAWQLLFHGRQMHRDFEMLYVERYWKIMDERSPEWRNNGELQPRDHSLVQDYLQLCEDEIDLRKLGRVTDSTWEFWARAIVGQTSEWPYAGELEDSAPHRYPRLRTLLDSNKGDRSKAMDPLGHRWLWRKSHGL